MRITDDVIVIGGGAAGVLFVAHLARLASHGVRVTIVDDGPGRLGSGTAYRTADEDHLLNVRTAGMSAWVDQPDHFVSWLAGRGTPARPGDFVPRGVYGAYLAAVANDAASGPLAHIRHVHARAVDATRARPHWRVRLSDGTTLTGSHVVLATGVGAPAPIATARRRPRYVADPWRPRALDGIGDS
ncbi:MAG TPA: FAD/NAD(P)-binding protein, partial [Micromonosporaceae bacterium]